MQKSIKVKPKADSVDIFVGSRLKQIRLFRRMSQEDVAKKLNISFQQIQKYEQGKNRISASRIFSLSKTLNVDVSDFFVGLNDNLSKSANSPSNTPALNIDSQVIEIIEIFNSIKNNEIKKHIISIMKKLMD